MEGGCGGHARPDRPRQRPAVDGGGGGEKIFLPCRLWWLERELGRGNPHLRAQGEGQAREVADVAVGKKGRATWERRQLLECVHHFLSAGAAITLLTGDTEVQNTDYVGCLLVLYFTLSLGNKVPIVLKFACFHGLTLLCE